MNSVYYTHLNTKKKKKKKKLKLRFEVMIILSHNFSYFFMCKSVHNIIFLYNM